MFGLFRVTEANSQRKPTKSLNIVFMSLFLLLILESIMLFGVSGNHTASGQFTEPVKVKGFEPPFPLSLGSPVREARVVIKVSTGEIFKGRVKDVYGASGVLLEVEETGERIIIAPHHIVYLRVLELPNFPKNR